MALVVTVLFVLVDCLMLKNDRYELAFLPLGLVVVWIFIKHDSWSLPLMALLTPFAINFDVVQGMQLSMPVEPLMVLFSLIFMFRTLLMRDYPVRVLRHPVTIALMVSVAWMAFTSATSQLPWVSVKYTIARLWFVIPFFFAAVRSFQSMAAVRRFFVAYAIGLGVVVFITTAKTLGNFSDLQTLHRVMKPFYNDHTAYGCVIALMLPAAVHWLTGLSRSRVERIAAVVLLALLAVGLFFSYCRAAWISIVAAIGVWVLIRLGMKVKWMVLLFGIGVGAFFVYQNDVLYKLGKNKQDSSYDLAGQVKSISNISTDASNVERLNRWASAMRMWREHPITGTGPGTYQFIYGSYQKSYQLSTISTNFGNLGNAHSEYIGPLAEQGLPGVAIVVALFMITFVSGVRVYRTSANRLVADTALAFTLSLFTYYVHGVFNNFLDTDKLSVPFWAFTAVVVAMDVWGEKKTDVA